MGLPPRLRRFIDSETWTFAKTMPEWPHEYLVRERVSDERCFAELIHHIRAYGSEQRFYQVRLVYYSEDGLLYWTMGAPVVETTIINRCREEDSYESRLARGELPPDRLAAQRE